MSTKFIKIKNLIISVDRIKSILSFGQILRVDCFDDTYDIFFSSENAARDECNRLFTLLTLYDF